MPVCWVCKKEQERPMCRFVNSKGTALYIHGHHRTMTVIKAGITFKLIKARKSRSVKEFVQC